MGATTSLYSIRGTAHRLRLMAPLALAGARPIKAVFGVAFQWFSTDANTGSMRGDGGWLLSLMDLAGYYTFHKLVTRGRIRFETDHLRRQNSHRGVRFL